MAERLTSVRRGPRGPHRRRSWSVTLTGERRDAGVARTRARHLLGSLECADDVLVVVSELVTNAVLHGRDPIVLTLTVEPDAVVVSVTDRGSAEPFRRDAGEDDDGRGLAIVDELTTHWHVERANGLKSVVAVVPATHDD